MIIISDTSNLLKSLTKMSSEKSKTNEEINKKKNAKHFAKELTLIIVIYVTIYFIITLSVSHIQVLQENSFLRGLLAISLLSFVYGYFEVFKTFFIHKTLLSLLIISVFFSIFNITEKKVAHLF